MELKPENGKTPADYLLEEEKNELQKNNATVDLSAYETSNFNFKCINEEGYLAASRDGWLELAAKSFKWKAYWKGKKENSAFVLEARNGPYKDYYIGHKTASILAGIYYWWSASDWLELLKDGTLINNKLDDRTLAKNNNGYFYWVNREEARSAEYTVLLFEKENA